MAGNRIIDGIIDEDIQDPNNPGKLPQVPLDQAQASYESLQGNNTPAPGGGTLSSNILSDPNASNPNPPKPAAPAQPPVDANGAIPGAPSKPDPEAEYLKQLQQLYGDQSVVGGSSGGSYTKPQDLQGLRQSEKDIQGLKKDPRFQQVFNPQDNTELKKELTGQIGDIEATGLHERAAATNQTQEAIQAHAADTANQQAAIQTSEQEVGNKIKDVNRRIKENTPTASKFWMNVGITMLLKLGGAAARAAGQSKNVNFIRHDQTLLGQAADLYLQYDKAHQEAQLAGLKEERAGYVNELDYWNKLFGRSQSAELAFQASQLNQLKLSLDSIANKTQGSSMGAKAKLMAMEIEEQRRDKLQKLYDTELQNKLKVAEIQAKPVSESWSSSAGTKNLQPKWKDVYIPGVRFLDPNILPNPENYKTGLALTARAEQLDKILGDLIEWRKKNGFKFVTGASAEGSKANEMVNQYMLIRKEAEGMGAAMSEGEKALIASFQDPGGTGFVQGKMEMARKLARRSLTEALKRNRYYMPQLDDNPAEDNNKTMK